MKKWWLLDYFPFAVPFSSVFSWQRIDASARALKILQATGKCGLEFDLDTLPNCWSFFYILNLSRQNCLGHVCTIKGNHVKWDHASCWASFMRFPRRRRLIPAATYRRACLQTSSFAAIAFSQMQLYADFCVQVFHPKKVYGWREIRESMLVVQKWKHIWIPRKVMDMVDKDTQKELNTAKDSTAISAILKKPSVRWQLRGKCLRHPDAKGGCLFPVMSDIAAWLTDYISCLGAMLGVVVLKIYEYGFAIRFVNLLKM